MKENIVLKRTVFCRNGDSFQGISPNREFLVKGETMLDTLRVNGEVLGRSSHVTLPEYDCSARQALWPPRAHPIRTSFTTLLTPLRLTHSSSQSFLGRGVLKKRPSVLRRWRVKDLPEIANFKRAMTEAQSESLLFL